MEFIEGRRIRGLGNKGNVGGIKRPKNMTFQSRFLDHNQKLWPQQEKNERRITWAIHLTLDSYLFITSSKYPPTLGRRPPCQSEHFLLQEDVRVMFKDV